MVKNAVFVTTCIIIAAVRNRACHYVFALWFLSFFLLILLLS